MPKKVEVSAVELEALRLQVERLTAVVEEISKVPAVGPVLAQRRGWAEKVEAGRARREAAEMKQRKDIEALMVPAVRVSLAPSYTSLEFRLAPVIEKRREESRLVAHEIDPAFELARCGHHEVAKKDWKSRLKRNPGLAAAVERGTLVVRELKGDELFEHACRLHRDASQDADIRARSKQFSEFTA